MGDLVHDLFTGAIQPGDKLPTEVAMAEEYGLARGTVSEVVRALEGMKVVKTRRGSGITAQDFKATAGLPFLEEVLSRPIDLGLLVDILQFRELMGPMMARVVAIALSKVQMKDILTLEELDQRILEALDKGDLDEAICVEEVYRKYLTELTGNLMLILFENSTRPIYRHVMRLHFMSPNGRVFTQRRRELFRAALMEKKGPEAYEPLLNAMLDQIVAAQREEILKMGKATG